MMKRHSIKRSLSNGVQAHTPSFFKQHSKSQLRSALSEGHINRDEYPSTAEEYTLTGEVGKGAFGTVYAATINSGPNKGKEVAIKVLDLDELDASWDVIDKEMTVMRLLDHPNVVQSYRSFAQDAEYWLVMPLMNGGSCAAIMKQRFPEGFPDEQLIATICAETLKGLQYLHEDDRIHRDVKAGNILLSTDGAVRLADYGVAGCLMDAGQKKGVTKTFTGTPAWMSPEVMESQGHDHKADIWSFGITVLELGYGKPPYAKHAPMKILMLTLQQDPPSTSSYGEGSEKKFSKNFKSFVDACLKKDPAKRPTAKELLKHKFLKKAGGPQYIKENLFKDQLSISAPKNGVGSNGGVGVTPVNEDNDAKRKKAGPPKQARKPISVEAFDFGDDDDKPAGDKSTSRFQVEYEEAK